jgi:hypothetical protein
MTKPCLSLLVILFAACGGGPGTGPVDQSTAETYCQEDCDHQASCDSTVDVTACVNDCVTEVVGVIREDVFADVTDCTTALACGAASDACFDDNCAPTSAHEAYESRCREAFAACDLSTEEIDGACETSPSTSASDVGYLCALTPEIMDELSACMDEADCQAILTCEQNVAEARGIDL